MSRGGDFWSRRKAAVRAEAEAEARAREAAQAAEDDAAVEEKSDEEVLAELGLKDPDEMQPGDDFSAFLKSAVPERLRRRALRKLWASNPVLACLDGLNDYDDDYTAVATNFDVRTAYKVGQGVVRRVAEATGTEPEAEDTAMAAAERDDKSGTAHESRESISDDSPETDRYAQFNTLSENDKTDADAAEEAVETPVSTPRRMRFRFD